jgi:hypothetical protein
LIEDAYMTMPSPSRRSQFGDLAFPGLAASLARRVLRSPKIALSHLGCAAILSLGVFFAGCKSGAPADSATTQSTARPIPPDSILAKIKVGMSQEEVFAKIGHPTSMDSYQTGKAFIPYHYSGSDDVRMGAHYKGVGLITFGNDSAYTSGYSVVDITYDPNEPGY